MLNSGFSKSAFQHERKNHTDLGSLSVQSTNSLGLLGPFIFEGCQTVVYDPVYTCVLDMLHVMHENVYWQFNAKEFLPLKMLVLFNQSFHFG